MVYSLAIPLFRSAWFTCVLLLISPSDEISLYYATLDCFMDLCFDGYHAWTFMKGTIIALITTAVLLAHAIYNSTIKPMIIVYELRTG